MKKYFPLPVVAGALTLTLTSSCTTMDALATPGERALSFSAGTQHIDVGDGLEATDVDTVAIDLELGHDPGIGVVGVLGVQFAQEDAEDLEFEGDVFDIDLDSVSAVAGLRWEPVGWDYDVTPFVGGGISYYNLEAQREDVPVEEDGDALDVYGELGVRWEGWHVMWRRTVPNLDLGIVGEREVTVESVLVGYTLSF